jgi:hypothetical protein
MERLYHLYRRSLIINRLLADILPVDCVFDGKTEFPQSYYDTGTDKE